MIDIVSSLPKPSLLLSSDAICSYSHGVSESITQFINAAEGDAGEVGFDYAQLSDEEAEQARDFVTDTKGFFILPSELFENVRKNAPTNPDLNKRFEQVFRNIEGSAVGKSSEKDIKGLLVMRMSS